MFGTKKNLETILSSFTKVVEDLEVLQHENAKIAGENTIKIVQLQEENATLLAESERAAAVADKINDLVLPQKIEKGS